MNCIVWKYFATISFRYRRIHLKSVWYRNQRVWKHANNAICLKVNSVFMVQWGKTTLLFNQTYITCSVYNYFYRISVILQSCKDAYPLNCLYYDFTNIRIYCLIAATQIKAPVLVSNSWHCVIYLQKYYTLVFTYIDIRVEIKWDILLSKILQYHKVTKHIQ